VGTVRRYLRSLGVAVIGILAVVVILGGSAIGLYAVAEQLRDNRLVAGLSVMLGRFLLVGGALLVTMFFFTAVLGPNLAKKVFLVRAKALTPEAVNGLRAKASAAVTVPTASGQGVLRVIPIKPEWRLDDAYAEDATPAVTVEDVEHRLSSWDPYDIAVRAGASEVVAWLPRGSGNPGRRVRNTVPVPQGQVTAVIFRPSSVPEVSGTLETLDSELTGNLSFARLTVGAALLIGITYGFWRLAAG